MHRWIRRTACRAGGDPRGRLWITNLPDEIDGLLFASPTPFSAWGVIAMWAVFAAAFRGLLPVAEWKSARTPNTVTRLHEEFNRRNSTCLNLHAAGDTDGGQHDKTVLT